MTYNSLRKQAETAPKYVLKMDGLNLYVSADQELCGCNVTDNINEAMQFSVGFDNEEIKLAIWTATAQKMMNTAVKFEIIYL